MDVFAGGALAWTGRSNSCATALDSEDNLARDATVTVSSTHQDYSPFGLTDGLVDGFPGDITANGAQVGSAKQ